MKEIWHDIPGYKGIYQGSNLGNIRSLPRKIYIRGKYGGYHYIKGHTLVPASDGEGYLSVTLIKNNHKVTRRVSRLICGLFHPNTYHYSQVDHIDGNVKNNCADNLRWCPQQLNESFPLRRTHLKSVNRHYRDPVLLVHKNHYKIFHSMADAARHVKLFNKNSSVATIGEHLSRVANPNDSRKQTLGYTCIWYTPILRHSNIKSLSKYLWMQSQSKSIMIGKSRTDCIKLCGHGLNKIFDNSTEAAKFVLNNNFAKCKLVTVRNSIMSVCRGRRNHCYGFTCKFLN